LALTWTRRHESKVVVLRRLVARIREIGLKIKRLLLDREFFNGASVGAAMDAGVPFLVPARRDAPVKRAIARCRGDRIAGGVTW